MKEKKKGLVWLLLFAIVLLSFSQPLFAGEAQETELLLTIAEGAGKISVKDSSGRVSEIQGEAPQKTAAAFKKGEKLQAEIFPEEGWRLENLYLETAGEEVRQQPDESGRIELTAGETQAVKAVFVPEAADPPVADASEKEPGEGEIPADKEADQEESQNQTQPDSQIPDSLQKEKETTEKSQESSLKDEKAAAARLEQRIRSFQVSREIASNGARENVYLTVGERAYYEEYYTHFFDVNGSTAYCLEPSKLAPASGTYSTTEMGEGLLRKTMYYVYGGAGYGVYREHFGNIGSVEYSEESEYCMSHCLVSFAYTGSMDAFTGLGEQTKNELLAELDQIKTLPDPPSSFEAFYFNMGSGSYQTMGGSWPLQYGWIEIRKSSGNPAFTDGNEAYSLEGARYEIYSKDTGEKAGEIRLDKDGKGKSGELLEGDYEIRETQTPKGYLLNQKTGNVTVTAQKTSVYSCEDDCQKGVIRLTKTDQEKSGQSLKGAVYEVRKKDGSLADTLTVDEQGKAQSKELPLGTYTVKEKTAPSGYLLDAKTYSVTFQGDTSSKEILYQDVESQENAQKGRIRLIKQDRETEGKPSGEGTLKGAVYELRDSLGNLADTLTTDESGEAQSKELPLGTYTIKETLPSVGYVKDSKTYTVTLSAKSGNGSALYEEVVSKETPQKGIILLEKSDTDTGTSASQGKGSLKGAVYTVKNSKDETVATLTTAEDGKAQSKELPLGTYTVKETKAAPGYLLDKASYTVKFTSENRTSTVFYKTVKSEETIIRGGVSVEKWDSEKEKREPQGSASLKGAQIQILSKNSNSITVEGKTYKEGDVITTLTTDETGKAKTAADYLPYGDYQLKEVKPPAGYLASGVLTRSFSIRENGKMVEMNTSGTAVKNQVIRGGVSVEKWDSEKNKREAQGAATLEGTQIQILSRNSKSILVGGKTYQEGEVIATLTTDREGKVKTSSDYLPYGNYQLKEIKAPTGYTASGTLSRNFSIRENGKMVEMNTADTAVKNQVIRGGVSVEKWDSEKNKREPQGGASLKGAQIQILSKNDTSILVQGKTYKEGDVITTLTTDEEGKAKTAADYLPYGDYQLKEVKPPAGYLASGVLTRSFSIRENGKMVEMNTADTAVKNQVIRGGVSVEKWDSEKNKREPQGGASLKGAQIQILSKNSKSILVDGKIYQEGEVITTLITDGEGRAKTEADYLPYGNYQLKEVKAPAGYTVSGTRTRSFSIRENGKIVEMNTADTAVKNQVIRGGVSVEKWDKEQNKKETQGAASFQGAEFQILSMNANTILVEEKEYKKGEVIAVLTTDKAGQASTENDLLPYGDYQIKEIKPPQGYNPTGVLVRDFSIGENGKIVQMNTSDTAIKNDVIRGDVQIVKFGADQEGHQSEQKKPLKGVCFTFTSKTTGKEYTIVTDENGYASTRQLGKDRGGLVYDTYVVTEDSPYADYAEIEPYEISISEEGRTLYYILENDVIEAPVSIVKKDKETGKIIPVKGSSFQILDQEKHLVEMTVTHYPSLVIQDTWETDETGSFLLPEKLKPGIYYLKEVQAPKGYLQGELLEFSVDGDYEWDAPLTVEYFDVPVKGQIRIEKRHQTTREKLQGAVFEIRAAEEIKTPDGTIRMQKGELADTVATGQDGSAVSKELYLGKYLVKETKPAPGFVLCQQEYEAELSYQDQVTPLVYDTLEIANQPTVLILDKKVHGSGQKLSGVEFSLWKKTDKEENGQENSQKQVYTTQEDGRIRIERLLPGTYCIQETKGIPGYAMDMEIHELTVDEDGKIDGKAEAVLAIENRETQLVKTQAVSADTGSREAIAKKETIITDRLTLKNLQPGETYTIKGVLMDREEKTKLLINRQPVTATVEFTAEKAEQEVENTFSFDASQLAGKTVVVFEQVWIGETQIEEHEDLEDPEQSITFPEHKIKTTAQNQKTASRQAAANQKLTITDTVKYENLIPGQEYTVRGILMDKETGEELKIKGQTVTSEKTFVPEEKNGSIALEFSLDARELTGKQVVVFERLYWKDTEAAGHTDLQDEGQTVEFPVPEIGTKAENPLNHGQEAAAGENTVIIDTVNYENLIPGQEYTLKGILMEKPAEKELKIQGKTITAEKSFTPKEASGTVEMEFVFDASSLTGTSLVVFERLYVEQTEVAAHADLQDQGQTILFPKPEIRTNARDHETGKQEAAAKKKTVLTDTVQYENLAVGTEYTVKGVLMDQETGKELQAGDSFVTAEKKFTAKEKTGQVELDFSFDARGLEGKRLVVFERLYVGKNLVASHTDLQDEAQTVFIKEKETVPQTGDPAPIEKIFLSIFLSGMILLTAGKKNAKRKKDT